MTEVVPADRTKLLQSKRAECSAIARSRKRKLCVLYAVATTTDGLPQRSFADPDAPPTNAAELHFLEGCDILQGRKLNELNIPTRLRVRSEYPPLARPGENFITSENAHQSRKKDVGAIVRPVMVPPPVQSRPGISDGQANIPSAFPTSSPGLKQHQPVWPIQSSGRPIRPDPPTLLSNDLSKPRFPSTEHVEHLPTNDRPDGAPKIPTSHTAASVNLPQPQVVQALVNDQRQRQQHQHQQQPLIQPLQHPQQQFQQKPQQTAQHGGTHLGSTHNGEPMDIDPAPATKLEEKAAVVHSISQVDGISGVDSVSSNSTTPILSSTTNNMDSARESMPLADSAEAKLAGMKDVASMRQNSLSLTTSEPSVAGTSESIPNRVKDQPLLAPTIVTTEIPINTSPKVNSAQSLNNTLSPSQPEKPVTTSFDQTTSSFHTIPQVPIHQPPNNDSRDFPITDTRNEKPPTDTSTTAVGFINGIVQSGSKNEVMEKETSVAPVDATPITPQLDSEGTRRSPQPAQSHQPIRERSSSPTGVARQKPVAEILSEPPRRSRESLSDHTALVTPTSQSSKQHPQSLLGRSKLIEKSKRSTVVFGKQTKPTGDSDKSLVQNQQKVGQIASDDYFTPLFVQAFASNSKWMRPLDQILHQAHKTLSTPDSYTQILDNQACKVLKRVYHLQHHNKWSLRQPKRCPEPTRQPCHWDVLLKEMKWMRTDFREERKWKMAAARNLAYACAEWVSASIEDRKTLQVDVIIPPKAPPVDTGEVIMGDVHNPQSSDSQPTPDLIPSADMDSPMEPDDEPHEGILDTVAPSAIFALENDDIVFALHQSPTADRLLEELPIYGSPLKVPKSDLTAPEYDPDASWRRPALPLSKFVEGRMELAPIEPPKKRSRYNYAQEDDEDDGVVFGQLNSSQPRLEPESPDVALFRPENKSFRDRLHAGHQFRPPNEHSMPFQSFYECRSPSQWIQSEDDELKSLVREYSYNWSLISSILSSKSLFSSGAERRTPWECFERWVMLEGLPHDMQKTQYFKLWQGRIESSQQVIRQHQNAMQQQAQQQQQQQQQQSNSNGPVTPIPKRRYNVPLKVERRRNQKHLTMIDAMRKLAKKRETAIQKQQHAASLAATRKPNETPQQRAPTKTPREYSIMRFERDQAMAERLAERMAQQQRHEAQRRAVLQRAQQGQVAQMAAAQNVNQLPQNNPQMSASHPHAAMARVGAPSQIPINSQGRPRMPMHATPNGTGTSNHMSGGLVPPMPMNGTSQVQMPTVNGQSRMAMPTAQPDIQLLMQAQQISEQQRRSVQMRQQQQQQQQQHQQQQQSQTPQGSMPLQSSPPAMRAAAMNGLNQKSYLTNAQAQAMMAQFNAGNGSGMSTPPAPGLPMTSQAGSPRPNTTIPQPTHQTYVSQLQHIESQIRQQHPNTPQDMVREMARQLLNTRHNNHNLAQSAMNAAAGATGHAAAANGPHQYAQLLRAQQQQQAAAAAAAQAQQAQQAQAQAQAQHGVQQQQQRNSSGSATPTPSVPK